MKIPNHSELDPRRYTGFTLWRKANDWERTLNQALKPFDITQSEILILISCAFLLQELGEITQVDIVEFIGVMPMSVSKTLKRLESNSLITRTTGVDTRSKSVTVTKQGMDILVKTAKIILEMNDSFFPEKGKAIFDSYLNSLNSNN